MTKQPLILVIAPDQHLRRSIAFALEAEGLLVEAVADLAALSGGSIAAAICAVVDENAVTASRDGWRRVAALPNHVILLIDRLRQIPEHYARNALAKPLLGRSLVEAVLAAQATGLPLSRIP